MMDRFTFQRGKLRLKRPTADCRLTAHWLGIPAFPPASFLLGRTRKTTQLGKIWHREAQQFTELKVLFHNETSKEFANSVRKVMRNMNKIKVNSQTYSTLKFVFTNLMKSVVKGRPRRCGHWSASAETAWLLSVTLDSVSLLTGKYQQVPKLMFHILLSVLRAAIACIPLQSSFELEQPLSVKP